jgi:predicted ATP-grasp superfamily ATP-dependent carboligase
MPEVVDLPQTEFGYEENRMDRTLIIAGASTRAAAQSALRAGFQPWLADMFADIDLATCGPVRKIEPYPHALLEILQTAPAAPWMYTGALENYPELIDELTSRRTLLWGNTAATVRQVRDPLKLFQVLRKAGFHVPEVRSDTNVSPDAGTWLRKPMRSAGGRSVVVVDADTGAEQSSHRPHGFYLQQRIVGQPVSAGYVAGGKNTELLGITAQLIGSDGSGESWCTTEWTGAKDFWYAGSIGPLVGPAWLLKQATEIGHYIANELGLIGLFGIDSILTQNALWPLEVNPRYTASIEVLERSTGLRAIEMHAEACRKPGAESRRRKAEPLQTIVGKAILYATKEIHVPSEFPAWVAQLNAKSAWPAIADIPHSGSIVPAGGPICTVFAEASNKNETMLGLRHAAKSAFTLLSKNRLR